MRKIIPVVLLVIILGVGFIAYTFYNKSASLTKENEELKAEKASLIEEKAILKDRYNKVERDKSEIEQKLSVMREELSRLEEERDTFKNRVEEVSRERDLLAEKLKQPLKAEVAVTTKTPEGVSEDYWADFVEKKAALEAKVDELNKALLEATSRITELEKDNKELSIKIDQLTKEKERLEGEIKFKERTLRVMSMDLVTEREERSTAVAELRKLRSENVDLKREIVLVNKEKMKLQKKLKETIEKKEGLEKRIMDIENALKEKSLAFEELQEELKKAVSEGKKVVAGESASVELPPIVVKPEAPGLKGLRGEVLAVNSEEKFVVIDIGESAGVRPGVLLKVMRGDREVGTVEVIETRREISAADIKEVSSGLTIQEGDIVINR